MYRRRNFIWLTAILSTLTLPLWAQAPAANCGCTLPPPIAAGPVSPALYAGMRWRQVGPFRGGRVSAVAGLANDPAVYYFGSAGGGVWKTTDGGWVWKPIFDAAHVASIGAIAVAPSDPAVVYVGTGNLSDVGDAANDGDGMWKSTDGGRTWRHIGLSATRHIPSVYVDPHNPRLVLVAALGRAFQKDPHRGIYRSTDGGRTWRRVLYVSNTVGAVDLAAAPDNPKVIYASVWRHYFPPLGGVSFNTLAGGAIYRSANEGQSWTLVSGPGRGLPAGGLGRIGLAVAPGGGGNRVYAIIAARQGGLFFSANGGRSWRRTTTDPRIVGNGYFSHVWVGPAGAVFVAQTALYRSTDGGRTFAAYKGAPGGDDYHQLWINPLHPRDMILGSDQGASISMDGGRSWSSWYNQPTGQMYHLATSNQFPFWIYATQQDSGAVGTASRGAYGEITPFDWDAVGGNEFGYIVPDPLQPWLIYCVGPGRGMVRINRRDHVIRDISPHPVRGQLRMAQNPPLVFSPANPRELFFGAQYLLATTDGGRSWRRLSPDLTHRTGPRPGGYYPPAIMTIAPSPRNAGVIWTGSNNGVIEVTQDGGADWTNVTPAAVPDGAHIEMIEASHFYPGEAFAAVNEHVLGNFAPLIYRTTDFGQHWLKLSQGIPDGDFLRVVREDPVRPGLLYAGTEGGVFVSFDNGGHWQSLQLNLPTVSVRDLAIRHNDLVAATYGRAFWILDDLTPLRQASATVAAAPAFLFRPEQATRIQRDRNQDTPLPPEIPHGQNPPAGAIVDYYLATPARGPLTLAIYTASGQLVRRYSSAPLPARIAHPVQWPHVPSYWLAHPRPLPATAGMHRVVWNLRYPAPMAVHYTYPISAVDHATPAGPQGPLAVPGDYTVRLDVDGHSYSQPLRLRLDPRLHATPAALAAQLQFEQALMREMDISFAGHAQAAALQKKLAQRAAARAQNSGQLALRQRAARLAAQAAQIAGGRSDGIGNPGRPPSFAALNQTLASLATAADQAPAAPTQGQRNAAARHCQQLNQVITAWNHLRHSGLEALNQQLRAERLAAIPSPAPLADPACAPAAMR